jgi:hypothetical protein
MSFRPTLDSREGAALCLPAERRHAPRERERRDEEATLRAVHRALAYALRILAFALLWSLLLAAVAMASV